MVCVDMAGTGANIKKMRMTAGKSVKDVQDACGVSAVAVCKWQKGISMPTIDNIVMLASLFGVEIGQIIATRNI